MSDQIEDNQDAVQVHADERALWPSPGAKLKKLREDLGYSREKISESLYITVHYVKALENDDFDKLPGMTFAKGYIRSYAQFLRADVEDILNCYENFIRAGEDTSKQETEALKARGNKQVIIWILLAVVLLVLLAGVTILVSNDANAAEAQKSTRESWQTQIN
jgi:cytoskeletal protein RodZ